MGETKGSRQLGAFTSSILTEYNGYSSIFFEKKIKGSRCFFSGVELGDNFGNGVSFS